MQTDKKEDTYLDEKSAYEKFLDELKNSIFNVLFVLLKEENANMIIFTVGVIVDYVFEMHYFPFS